MMTAKQAVLKVLLPLICFVVVAATGLGVYFGVYFDPKIKYIDAPDRESNPFLTEDELLAQKYEFILCDSGDAYRIDRVKERGIEDLTIPTEFRGLPVTELGNGVFSRHLSIRTIRIGDNIQKVGKLAFSSCQGVNFLEIGKNVVLVDEGAFLNCTDLGEVHIQKYPNRIEKGAFEDCPIETLTIDAGVVGDAFASSYTASDNWNQLEIISPNETLKNVNLGEGVTHIDALAFFGCTALCNLQVSQNLAFIGQMAFSECSALESVSLPKTYIYFGSGCFEASGLKNISISKDWFFEWGCFYGCTQLQTVVFEEGATFVQNSSFCGCTALQRVTLPSSVTKIDNWAFADCDKLQNIIGGSGVETINYRAFSGCVKIKSISYFPKLSYVGQYAFEGCPITSVVSSTIISIGSEAFKNCPIETLSLPNVEEIDYRAFMGCDKLESVNLGSKLESIGIFVFSDCDALVSISFAKGLDWDNLNTKPFNVDFHPFDLNIAAAVTIYVEDSDEESRISSRVLDLFSDYNSLSINFVVG